MAFRLDDWAVGCRSPFLAPRAHEAEHRPKETASEWSKRAFWVGAKIGLDTCDIQMLPNVRGGRHRWKNCRSVRASVKWGECVVSQSIYRYAITFARAFRAACEAMYREGGNSVSGFKAEAAHSDEHERTMAIADVAMGQIRALQLPATPRSYEIWYAYATGHYPTLNLFINDLLAHRVPLSDADIDQIGTRFVSPNDTKDRIDTVGACVANEIGRVAATIHSTISLAGAHSEDLVHVDGTLSAIKNRDTLRAVVERLEQLANRMQDGHRKLEAQFDTSKSQIKQLRVEMRNIAVASLTDPVTGLANRKLLERSLQKAIAAAVESGKPLSVVIGGIDHFKRFNDSWGHVIGDQVLQLVAQTLKNNVRPEDTVARYGGEQFAVVLPDATLKAAYAMADHVRHLIMSREIVKRSTDQDLGRVTVSFGVVSARAYDTINTLVARADTCLYAAKCNGRNRVIDETDPQFLDTRFKAAIVG
jgi:diguanylate cyclase